MTTPSDTIRDRFMDRFRGLMRAHGTYAVKRKNERKNKMEGQARTLQEAITPSLWSQHLEGSRSLGVVPIDDASLCHFGAIDIDVYDGLNLAELEKLIAKLGLPLIVCRTKSGGAHLYFFASDPVPAKLLRYSLLEFSIAVGHPNVEVFPKQIALGGPDDVGNWINLPYFGGKESDRYAIHKGKKLSPEGFLDYADAIATDEEGLKAVKLPEVELLEEAPPCLQHLARASFPDGTRNNGLFSLGVYAKKVFPDRWEEQLDELNRRFMEPPLSTSEVGLVTKSLRSKEYGYKCSDEPLKGFCNRALCLKRKYGIEGNNDPGIVFGGLTKIETDPPTWVVDVDGIRIEIDSTGDLLMQERFRVYCMDKMNKLPNKVKGNTWEKLIQDMLENVEIIEAPADAGARGQLLALLESFCTDRAQARNREEIILGKPWNEKGRVYFRGPDFLKYLDAQRFTEIKSAKGVWSVLRSIKADHSQFVVKGKNTKVWSVPEDMFSRLDSDLDVPTITEEEEF